jgi:hypothetical protein
MLRNMRPASIPSISRISGWEWFKMTEYLVLRRASGTRGCIWQVLADGPAGGLGVGGGAAAAALANERGPEGGTGAVSGLR